MMINHGPAVTILLNGEHMSAIGLAELSDLLQLADEALGMVAFAGHYFDLDSRWMSEARYGYEQSDWFFSVVQEIEAKFHAGQVPSTRQCNIEVLHWSIRKLPGGTRRSEERRVGKECRSRWSP